MTSKLKFELQRFRNMIHIKQGRMGRINTLQIDVKIMSFSTPRICCVTDEQMNKVCKIVWKDNI